jgi:hypothetical protein
LHGARQHVFKDLLGTAKDTEHPSAMTAAAAAKIAK